MLEVRYRTARALPLPPIAAAEASTMGIEIRPAGAQTRLSLRVREPGAEGAGFPLNRPINSLAGNENRWIARLGPDEWLIGAPETEADHLPAALSEALGARAHSVVDVSHRNVGIDVSGARAAALLNAGCPLDLGDAAFPAGSATRTLLGKAEVVLIRYQDAMPRYRVECWRSFATYVHGFLKEAAFGLGPDRLHATR